MRAASIMELNALLIGWMNKMNGGYDDDECLGVVRSRAERT